MQQQLEMLVDKWIQLDLDSLGGGARLSSMNPFSYVWCELIINQLLEIFPLKKYKNEMIYFVWAFLQSIKLSELESPMNGIQVVAISQDTIAILIPLPCTHVIHQWILFFLSYCTDASWFNIGSFFNCKFFSFLPFLWFLFLFFRGAMIDCQAERK